MAEIRYGGVVAGEEEIAAVTAVLRGQYWACGEVTAQFEAAAAAVQGRAHALFVNSGSSALLLALATLAKGARVAMPALQFPTLYGAAVWCRLEPVLVDVDDTLNMDPAALDAVADVTPGLDAAAFVHMAGNPSNAPEVAAVCAAHGMVLIEDICEALGARTGTTMAGNAGKLSVTSTHAAHQISTGEGGLVFTGDTAAFERMRRLRDWGRAYNPALLPGYYPGYVFSEPGLNLHASDIQAALGLVQLRRLSGLVAQRNANHAALLNATRHLPLTTPRVAAGCAPSWYTFPFLADDRDKLAVRLAERGIESRPVVAGNMARQPVSLRDPSAFPVADDVFRRGLWVSVHPRLSAADIARIAGALEEFTA